MNGERKGREGGREGGVDGIIAGSENAGIENVKRNGGKE